MCFGTSSVKFDLFHLYKDKIDSEDSDSSLSDESRTKKIRICPSKFSVRVPLKDSPNPIYTSRASMESTFDDFEDENRST